MLLIALLCAWAMQIHAQNELKLDIISPSPNSSSLGKYGNIPVSHYTGTYNLNIPVYRYTTPMKDFSLAISLNYHTGGIKIDEMASNVGLGWALSAGGAISRTMVGLPDDSQYGYMNTPEFDQTKNALRAYHTGIRDSEPDVFNYNFNGRSGRFYINKRIYGGNVHVLEKSGLKISYETINPSSPIIDKFTITTEDGIKYTFNDKEMTFYSRELIGNLNYTSSWMLSKIEFPYTQKNIVFNYETFQSQYASGISESGSYWVSKIVPIGGSLPTDIVTSRTVFTTVLATRLLSIDLPSEEKIRFVYNTPRPDMQNDKQLDYIYLDNNQTMGLKLSYDYFIGGRLRLKQITAIAGNETNGSYSFEYNEINARLSKGQDFWGFANGKSNNSLIPKLENYELGYFEYSYGERTSAPPGLLNDGDRRPDPQYANSGTLRKVTYPTGGSTTFDYEINTTADKDKVPYEHVEQKNLFLSGFEDNKTAFFKLERAYGQEQLRFTFGFRDYPHGLDTRYNFRFTIKSLNDAITYGFATFNFSNTNGAEVVVKNSATMPAGDYKIVWSSSYNGVLDEPFTFSLKWKDIVTDTISNANLYVGGVRIKEIRDDDGIGNYTTRSYKYVKEDGFTSSGRMAYKPVYNYKYTILNGQSTVDYIARSAFPTQSLADVQGSPIAYERITESLRNGTQSIGETVYTYTVPSGFSVDLIFPFPMIQYHPWENGLLLERKIYDKAGILKKKERNDYLKILSANEIIGQKVGQTVTSDDQNIQKFKYLEYYVSSGYSLKTQARTTEYFSATDSLTDVVKFDYEPAQQISHFQPVMVTQQLSSGNESKKIILYPSNYTGTAFTTNLLSKNIISTPIETVTLNKNNEIVEGTINQYYPNNSSLKELTKLLNVNEPIPLTSFRFSNQPNGVLPGGASTGTFLPDSRYETRLNYHRYDANGCLLNFSVPEDGQEIYLWSYRGVYPVVTIKNADYALVENILGGAAAIQNFSNSVPANKAAIDAFIAPLRIDPRLKDAKISTYTFNVLNGMTSQTDSKGITSTYEYDSFQRLKYLKDQDGNIIKSFDYNYKP